MQFYLISDNTDTLVGMRLAGVDGVIVHDSNDVKKILLETMDNKDVAIVLMTEKLVRLNQSLVYELKLNRRQPLIVEIPDRHGTSSVTENIAKYIESAIGLKL